MGEHFKTKSKCRKLRLITLAYFCLFLNLLNKAICLSKNSNTNAMSFEFKTDHKSQFK